MFSLPSNHSVHRESFWYNYPPPPLNKTMDNHHHVRSAVLPTTNSGTQRSIRKSGYSNLEDYLGLSSMVQKMSVSEPIPTGLPAPRTCNVSTQVSDDFRLNGIDTEMDELDRYIYQLRSDDGSPRGSPPTVASSISPASASPPSSTSTLSPLLESAFFEFCRERERKFQLDQLTRLALTNPSVLSALPPPAPVSPPIVNTPSRSSRSRHGSGGQNVCVFCRNNGEPVAHYTGHCLKDSAGRVTCPVLRAYKCPYCRASGDNAHTKTYCPLAIQLAGENGPIPASRLLKTDRTSIGKKKKTQRPLIGGAHHALLM